MESVKLTSTIILLLTISTTPMIRGDLKVEDVNEGPCISSLKLLPLLYRGGNPFQFVSPRSFYVPMGSQALYRHYATALLGRPPVDQVELDAMKLNISISNLLTNIKNTGYPNSPSGLPEFQQLCLVTGLPSLGGLVGGNVALDYVSASCSKYGDTNGANSTSFAHARDSLIWTDNDTTALIQRCPIDNIQDWKVISTNKTLNADTINIIKQKIVELGFSESRIQYMNYD